MILILQVNFFQHIQILDKFYPFWALIVNYLYLLKASLSSTILGCLNNLKTLTSL